MKRKNKESRESYVDYSIMIKTKLNSQNQLRWFAVSSDGKVFDSATNSGFTSEDKLLAYLANQKLPGGHLSQADFVIRDDKHSHTSPLF